MKKIFRIVYFFISLFIYSEAYSCKNDNDCQALGPGYKCCYDLSKAKHECIYGCGCNDKDAAPEGYKCCYDPEKAHHMYKAGDCCKNEDCSNQVCCNNVCSPIGTCDIGE